MNELLAPALLAAHLTLRDAVARALSESPRIAAVEGRVAAATQRSRAASSPFRPSLWVTTTPGYSSGLPIAVAGRVPAIAGAEATQTIYSTSRRAAAIDAEAEAKAAATDAARTRTLVAREAAVAFARVALGASRVETARRREEAARTIARRVGLRRDEGRATELDAARSALEEARARQAALDAASDLDLSRRELARLVGADAAAIDVAAEMPRLTGEAPLGDVVAQAVAADPVLKSLEEEAVLRRRSARLLSGWLAPEVDAAAQYARLSRANHYDEYYAKFKADDWSVGVSVAIPILTGGRKEAERARALAEASRADAEREARLRDVTALAEKAAAERDRLAGEVALARRAASLEDEALRLANVLRLEGRGDADAVEAAEVERARAIERLAASQLALLDAELSLLEIRGTLVPVLLGEGGIGAREDRKGETE